MSLVLFVVNLRRDLAPAFAALHRDIAGRSARILFRGTGVKSFNQPAR